MVDPSFADAEKVQKSFEGAAKARRLDLCDMVLLCNPYYILVLYISLFIICFLMMIYFCSFFSLFTTNSIGSYSLLMSKIECLFF